jgi:hypothetical protein
MINAPENMNNLEKTKRDIPFNIPSNSAHVFPDSDASLIVAAT